MNSLNNFTTFCRRTGCARILLLILPLAGADCFGQQQQSSRAVEEIQAVFDVGVVYQPKAGEYGITELMNAVGDAPANIADTECNREYACAGTSQPRRRVPGMY